MKYFIIMLGIIALGSYGTPFTASAYLTTGQESLTVNGQIGVYVIDFAFGHERYDIHIPAPAYKSAKPSPSALTFEVVDEHGTKGLGTAVGIVLSDAQVKDGHYTIPKGIRSSLRLLVLYTKSGHDTGNEFSMQVTHLPFTFDGKQQLQLNPSELQYYTTKPVLLGTGLNIKTTN
jgi:hypothetical protein